MNKWEKAWSLVVNQKVWLNSIVRNKKGSTYFLTVEGNEESHTVILGDKIDCDCKYSSLHPDGLCSHKIAAIVYLTFWKRQQKVREMFWKELDKIKGRFL